MKEAKKHENNPETEPLLSVLRVAIEATADGLLVTDKQGRVLCYNQFYVNMWPIPGELLGRTSHEAIIQHCFGQLRDPEQFLRMTREIYAMWPPESLDVLQFNDGRVFERYTRGGKILKGQDMVRAWSLRNITERRQADAYKAQLAAIVESSSDAIIAKDLNGIITSWNAGAERIFGYRASEIIGSSIEILIPSDRADEESKIMSLIKSGKRTDHFETVRWGKGKKPIDVSITISPMKDEAQ